MGTDALGERDKDNADDESTPMADWLVLKVRKMSRCYDGQQ